MTKPAFEWRDDDFLSLRVKGFDLSLKHLKDASNSMILLCTEKIKSLLSLGNLDVADELLKRFVASESRDDGSTLSLSLNEIAKIVPSFVLSKSFLFFFFFVFFIN
jgi:hypothetical protein